jgi:hypothetical protein
METCKKLFRQRKGIIAFNFLVTVLLRFTFLLIMLIVSMILLSIFLNNKFDVTDTQAEILISGFIYGTGGISYYDPVTGRIYPQIIELDQLDSAELEAGLYFPDNNMMTARITVKDKDRQSTLKTMYYNKEWYDNWKPLIPLKHLKGIGGVTDFRRTIPVILKDEDGTLSSAYVEFQIVQPKSLRSKKK